jgi:hypothetical protein
MPRTILEWFLHIFQNAGAAALLIAFARVIWSIAGWLIRVTTFYFGRKTMRYGVPFGPIEHVPKSIEGVYCQIVRYGTDLYIEKMASDQEKYEGRLQNKVRRLRTRRDRNGEMIVSFDLPVHKRIGTQFKTFVRVRDPADLVPVEEFLKRQSFLADVKVSGYQKPPKISFTLKMFPTVDTVDGLKNNFFFPV